jgi:hypothetical protein
MINKNNLRKFIEICKKMTRNEVINLSDDITHSFSAPQLSQKYNLTHDDVENAKQVQKFINLCYFYDDYYVHFGFKCLRGGAPPIFKALGPMMKHIIPVAHKVITQAMSDPETIGAAAKFMSTGQIDHDHLTKVLHNSISENHPATKFIKGAAKNEHMVKAFGHVMKGEDIPQDTMNHAVEHISAHVSDHI